MSADARSQRAERTVSLDTQRHNDGFETWDTSEVQLTPDDEDGSPVITKRTRPLETIPGSRPVSPAKPLDGPFPEEALKMEQTLPDSPMQPLESALPLHELSPSRRSSTTRSHIHPLFRPESPLPPPLPSPGTVITASPLAGQIVSQEQALNGRLLNGAQGQRLESGHATPQSPTRSRAQSRNGSIQSVNVESACPQEGLPSSPLCREHGYGDAV
ncbi:hypothetical protein BAUCODRAFT_148147 [Baudoinia panamericana UAMH 10762]|uniref:Uncharacterized protein n=1 Tax=Baudoinia panamericana (strain UAMH 10762) TaxID=717646 RepID=M2MYB6_BAUPA|nr:uncharacterized protein BAUCODRAFT_148147 [Baudoinia panamericana UAMH 10762]EMC96558.1 hypothetical protein BAUCODRAFT_148147 [Baudoinia panamericana UAMH 10762]